MEGTNFITLLAQYGPGYIILGFVLWWLFTKYIPSKDAEHSKALESAQQLFRETLDKIVTSYEVAIANDRENSKEINSRLDKIEEVIIKHMR